jgi:hypothetical protein
LSYVANAGFGDFRVASDGTVAEPFQHSIELDLDSDSKVSDQERDINFATGVFWRATSARHRMTFDWIASHDGTTQTIVLTESLNAGRWASRQTMDIAFVVGRQSNGR